MPGVDHAFIDWLGCLDCSGVKVTGLRDGHLAFANEPLLTLEGPFALLQLLETPILNLVNFSSLVTTNASRMFLTAGPKVACVEFGLRRAQGPNGSLTASKYAYMGGCIASSNVQAGYIYDIPVAGTQAHSFIMSHDSEDDIKNARMVSPNGGDKAVDLLDLALKYRTELGWNQTILKELYAFVAFATVYPNHFAALVDSYSTKDSGIKNFVVVALALSELGYKALSIRLDSGNLAELSIFAKAMFADIAERYNQPHFKNIKVVASNDINESVIN